MNRVRWRWAERSLIVVGAALLLLAGGARLVGEIQGKRQLARFEAAAGATGVDTRLWSPERIRAFEESLRKDLGAPLAVLVIPKIGLEVPVVEGTDELALNRAVGLIEGTARPGETGNTGIAGHRDGFFRGLKDVAVGDEIELKTLAARHRYAVESIRIVSPDDVWVLDPTPSPVLTLVTCYPFYFVGSAPQRCVVRAARRDVADAASPAPTRPDTLSKKPRREDAFPQR